MISCSGKRSIFDASDYAYRLKNLKEKSKGKSRKIQFSILAYAFPLAPSLAPKPPRRGNVGLALIFGSGMCSIFNYIK